MTGLGYGLALALWIGVPIVFFSRKTFYFGFCVLLLLIGGTATAEWAPIFWTFPEFVFFLRDFFKDHGNKHLKVT